MQKISVSFLINIFHIPIVFLSSSLSVCVFTCMWFRLCVLSHTQVWILFWSTLNFIWSPQELSYFAFNLLHFLLDFDLPFFSWLKVILSTLTLLRGYLNGFFFSLPINILHSYCFLSMPLLNPSKCKGLNLSGVVNLISILSRDTKLFYQLDRNQNDQKERLLNEELPPLYWQVFGEFSQLFIDVQA